MPSPSSSQPNATPCLDFRLESSLHAQPCSPPLAHTQPVRSLLSLTTMSMTMSRVGVRTFSIYKRGGCEIIPLFKLQNHCSTRAVQRLMQVFHLVFHLHLWCSTLHPAPAPARPAARRGREQGGTAQLPHPRAPPPRLHVSSCATCCLLYDLYCYIVKPAKSPSPACAVRHVLLSLCVSGVSCSSCRRKNKTGERGVCMCHVTERVQQLPRQAG
jgi:hypothetical protein